MARTAHVIPNRWLGTPAQLQPPPRPLYEQHIMATEPFRITIDGDEYPCTEFGWVQDGEKLERVWPDGFWDGIGESRVRSPRRCLFAHFMDLTSPPYVRLGPVTTSISLAAVIWDLTAPVYTLRAVQPNGVNVVYFFNKTYRVKVDRDTNVVIESISTANVEYGRPALFESTWRIARGDSVDAATLTINDSGTANVAVTTTNTTLADTRQAWTVNAETGKVVTCGTKTLTVTSNTATTLTGSGGWSGGGNPGNGLAWSIADTLTPIAGSIKAKHFANIQDEGTAKLARTRLNFVSLSVDGVTFGGENEVGDSSLPSSDLLEAQGELIVIRPDGPYRFDPQGNSLPLQKFVGRNINTSVYDGSNSHGHGTYAYWVTATGIWRIFGDSIVPIGFESDPQYFASQATDIDATGSWHSVTAYGRWLYATRASQLWQAFIEEDGKGRWFGALIDKSSATSTSFCRVVTDDGTVLWLCDTYSGDSKIIRIPLQADGSVRAALDTNRGSGIGTPRFWLGTDDFDKPDRLKQIRRFWIVTEKITESVSTLRLRAIRDGGSEETIGASITTNGLIERVPTITSSDLFTFREARFGVDYTVVSGTNDPRWRAMGVDVRTADIYKAKIVLTSESVRGYALGIQGLLQELKLLKNTQLVAVKRPEVDATQNAYVLSVRDKVVMREGGEGIGYEVDVLLEFFNIPASVA